jgi:hypothetical protein
MSVVPSDILTEDRLKEKSSNPIHLTLRGVVQAGHEDVAHHEVDEPDATCSSSWKEKLNLQHYHNVFE